MSRQRAGRLEIRNPAKQTAVWTEFLQARQGPGSMRKTPLGDGGFRRQ